MARPRFLRHLRNTLLANPRFIAGAQRVPLTRWIARRKSLDLFDLLAGFSYSQVLYACVTLRLLEQLEQSGLAVCDLAPKLGLSEQKTEVLVRAAVALDILERDGDRICLGPHGATLLGQPWILKFVEHHRHFYLDLADPVAMLKGRHASDGLRSFWNYDHPSADKAAYTDLMASSQAAVSNQILAAYDFSAHRRLLDLGGGSGAFLRAVGARYPQLALNLFDLPGVVALAAADAGRPIATHSGDFRTDPLPQGMDIITVIRILHDHDDDAVLALLHNIRKVCTPDTVLLIAEPFSGQASTARVTDAYFSLYFAALGQGRTRTPADIAQLAAQAGFGSPQERPTQMPLITGLMTLKPTVTRP